MVSGQRLADAARTLDSCKLHAPPLAGFGSGQRVRTGSAKAVLPANPVALRFGLQDGHVIRRDVL